MKRLTRKEMVKHVASKTGLTQKKTNEVIDQLSKLIKSELKKKHHIFFKGLFRVGVRQYDERYYCHPITQKLVKMEKRARPFVKFSRDLILEMRGKSHA